MRVVPLMSQTATILQKYLNMWHLDAARKPDDPVFVNHQGKRLTRPGVTYILNKYMAQVSWMEDKKGITPHVIRHSKAMHLLRADVVGDNAGFFQNDAFPPAVNDDFCGTQIDTEIHSCQNDSSFGNEARLIILQNACGSNGFFRFFRRERPAS